MPPSRRCTSGIAFGFHASCLSACRAVKNSSVVVIAVVVVLTSSFWVLQTLQVLMLSPTLTQG